MKTRVNFKFGIVSRGGEHRTPRSSSFLTPAPRSNRPSQQKDSLIVTMLYKRQYPTIPAHTVTSQVDTFK